MLDVTLHDVNGVSLNFAKSTHTAIVGPPSSGISTLLRVIAGDVTAGLILIGARDVTKLKRERRPLLYVTREIEAPARWSVRHALIAAVRQRTLDRVDRQHEFTLAAAKWKLEGILDRVLRSLSDSERTAVNLARIELLKPAILIADGVLDRAPVAVADEFYRTLRVLGTTVIAAPASTIELGFTDRVVVIDGNRVVQDGTFSHVYRHPASPAAASSTGEVNLVPITIRGTQADSVIGSWDVDARFEGQGIAAIRPEHFEVAGKGEESDLIFGIEEATFHGTHWRARGILTGNIPLIVSLPADTEIHKGRLLALRFDPRRTTIFPV